MSESDELYSAINYIKHKVTALEKIELLNLRSNKIQKDEYIQLLRNDNLLYQVYKAIDGIRPQKEIALCVGTTEKSVSIKIQILIDQGLIEIKTVEGNRKIYVHSIAEFAYNFIKELG